jgi:hypothetical protein
VVPSPDRAYSVPYRGLLFDEVDEDCRVHRNGAGAKVSDQSHEARSCSTCAAASAPRQHSLPSPLSSRIDSRLGVSRASVRMCATSCATERRCRFARACSFRYSASGRFLTFSVAKFNPPCFLHFGVTGRCRQAESGPSVSHRSSVSRTRRASACGVNGFCRNGVPSARPLWRTMASSA